MKLTNSVEACRAMLKLLEDCPKVPAEWASSKELTGYHAAMRKWVRRAGLVFQAVSKIPEVRS